MTHFILIFISPLLLAFSYSSSLQNWVLNDKNLNAEKISKYKKLKSVQQSCDYEQDLGLFPKNCFLMFKLIHEIDPSVSIKEPLIILEKQCIERIHQISTRNQIHWLDRNVQLKNSCFNHYQKRKEIVLYKLGG